MDNFKKFILDLTNFSEESWELLKTALKVKEFRKNEVMLKEGEICNSLFYIDRGFCRSYYIIDGSIKNIAFYFENEIATNINSFGTGQKSEYNIIACEPLKSIILDKDLLFKVSAQSSEIENLGRNCIRLFATKQEEFSKLFKIFNAQERLEYIENKYPEILQRTSLTQLSSFLGVSRETLSRIRNRRVKV